MNKKLILVFSFLSILSISLFYSCERIEAGYEGIKVNLYGSSKGIDDISLVTGRVWFNPFTQVVDQYPLFIQTIDYLPFTVNARDGSEFIIDPTLSYNIVEGNAPKIYAKYRLSLDEISETTIYNYLKDSFRLQMNKYTTEEIVSDRAKFENDVQNTLFEILSREGFRLEQLTSGISYPSTIVEEVNNKNKAVQEAMKVDNEVKIAEAEARKMIVQAEAQAKVLVIQAEAEKKSNEIRSQSLTPMLIEQLFIEKWDGKTPLYGSSPVFFKPIQ